MRPNCAGDRPDEQHVGTPAKEDEEVERVLDELSGMMAALENRTMGVPGTSFNVMDAFADFLAAVGPAAATKVPQKPAEQPGEKLAV